MTVPHPDLPPHSADHTSSDEDPTGVRALLAALPDPGPMPEHLVARIHQALDRERAGTTGWPPVPGPDQLPLSTFAHAVPLLPHDHPTPPSQGESLDAARARRRPWLLPAAAAAGLVLIAGGTLVASRTAPGLTASLGWSSPSLAAQAPADPAKGASISRDSAGASVPPPAAVADSPGSTTVSMSETIWSDPTEAAQRLLITPATPLAPLASESPAIGPIGTELGARDCATALGVPATAPIVVDLGTYAGTPAALVVATSSGGGHTAYVVGRACRLGAPELRSGPFRF